MKREKVLPCVFFDDISCSFRKDEKPRIVSSCLKCEHYKAFVGEIEREEEEFWKEVDKKNRGCSVER